MGRVLIVDRESEYREELSSLYQESEHEIQFVNDYRSATTLLHKLIFDVVIFDTSISDGEASSFVELVKKTNQNTIVFITTEKEKTEEAIKAVNNGAFDIIQKPFRPPELEVKVTRAISTRRLRQEAETLRDERNIIYKAENFIGESPEIKKIFEIVGKIAKSNSTVLLNGETGTGKELIAGAIHYNSHRADLAFVKVNCAALQEQPLESELFGHEKGAFEGAKSQRIGCLEHADGGSIFIDEVGDMNLSTQEKLLRVLRDGEFARLGSKKPLKVDVRIISATNKNLLKEIEESRFREDLFYRLNVVTLHVPPLRERKGDIILLVYFFLKKYCSELKKGLKEIHPRSIKLLTEYSWPGNIQELQNTIERAVLVSEGNVIKPEDLGLPLKMERMQADTSVIKIPPGGISLEEVEKDLILQALKMSDWIQKDAADLLGISTRVLNYKIQRLRITHTKWRRNK